MIERITQLEEILDFSRHQLSDILPSQWAEENMVVSAGKYQGRLSYDRTPYSREIVDCFSPYHYATEVTLMGGAQWGKSTSVIEPVIAYTISQYPCNIGFLTGHSDLSEEAMVKLDNAIQAANIGHLIRPSVVKARNSRTGDTNKIKEFIGGSIVSGSATNHKLLRQRSWQLILADDLEAAKGASKESGSTIALIRERAKSFGNSKKILWCSTPENKLTSLIEPLFLAGDQRYYHIPCPCCGTMIYLQWSIDISEKEKAGFTWKVDSADRLIPGSVEYICQVCAGAFDESHKYEINLAGKWIPTATPEDPTHVSFKLPSLYAMPGMNGWEQAVRDYLKAAPTGQPVNKRLMQTFVNLTLGECYEEDSEAPSANAIQRNCRNYAAGTIPEKLSLSDGNGRIVLLTCAADMNGLVDDARLDYEVVAWSEGGQSYSIQHGSIGTFVPREGQKNNVADRAKWTYEFNRPNSVWDEFNKIIFKDYPVDTGRNMKIYQTGLDCGYYSANYAYPFLDKTTQFPRVFVVGLKGKGNEEYIRITADKKYFKPAQERPNLFILTVGSVKDDLAEYMQLRWAPNDPAQPYGFMNFPTPANGMYTYQNYFEHFEGEHCVTEANKDGTGSSSRWQKKNAAVMNHMWDVRVYNMAVREIIVESIRKELKAPKLTWKEFCYAVTGGK